MTVNLHMCTVNLIQTLLFHHTVIVWPCLPGACMVLTSVSNAVITHAKVLSVGTSENFLVPADCLNFLKASCKTALKKYCQA